MGRSGITHSRRKKDGMGSALVKAPRHPSLCWSMIKRNHPFLIQSHENHELKCIKL